jgi:hypothetical protein
MARKSAACRRRPRLRTELSEADEARLSAAGAMFCLPKAVLVGALIRASMQSGSDFGSDSFLMKLRRRFGRIPERNQRHAVFPRFEGASAWIFSWRGSV